MANMTIRDMNEIMERRLNERAARHGRSAEEEARDILGAALSVDNVDAPGEAGTGEPTHLYDAIRRRPHAPNAAADNRNMAERIRARVERFGGVELPDIPREIGRDPPDFGA